MSFEDGRVSLERSATSGGTAGLLELDIAVLSQLLVGELDVRSAIASSGARAEGDIARISELFGPVTGFRLLDEF
jgi:hypothetical protein